MSKGEITVDKPIVIQNGGASKYAIYGIGILIALVLAYFFLYKPWKKQQETLRNNTIDPTTKQGMAKILATKLRTAMEGWGTNEELMFTVADQIRENKIPWADVATAYYNLYQRDLVRDVQSELDSKEIVEFWRRINPGTTPAPNTQKTVTQNTKTTAVKTAVKTTLATNPITAAFSYFF